MKVFLVGDFPKDDKIYGGVEGVLINLANELVKNIKVELVLVSMTEQCNLKRFERKSKIHKLNLKANPFKTKKRFHKIFLDEKPDIIHVQGVVPGAWLFKKEYRNIFTVTQHAILSEERLWQVTIKRKVLFFVKEKFENYYLKKIKNVIFISKYNRDLYFKKFGKNLFLKYENIVNPVNKVFFDSPSSFDKNRGNELYFVGEIKKRKGLHVLINAIAKLKQQGIRCTVHVIGGFKELQYEKEIKILISELKVSDQIVFCGWKTQSEIMSYIKEVPIFVLPSFQETLPLSIAEAMCQGKIVVATNICGIPEMIQHEKSGYLFEKGNHDSLANILKSIFQNDQSYIIKNALEESKRYHPEKVVNQTIAFYSKIGELN